MAAAIPAANKWLLTKHAAVAPSGSRRSDSSESERRAGGGGAGRRSSGVEVILLSESTRGEGGGGREVGGWVVAGVGKVGVGGHVAWRGGSNCVE